MFDKFQRALATFFSSNRLYGFAILVALVVILQLAYSYSDKFVTRDLMTSEQAQAQAKAPGAMDAAHLTAGAMSPATTGLVANPTDLLPHDVNSQWGDLNTLGKNSVNTPDLLQAGYHIGLDTVGQTLRNANLQERSDPIIPKMDTGPWAQSTIEPDFGRTPMEIGMGPR